MKSLINQDPTTRRLQIQQGDLQNQFNQLFTQKGITSEQIVDAVAEALVESATIEWAYDDDQNEIAANVKNSSITETKQLLADNVTHNVSTSMHGYAPKGDGDTAKFLNGNGAYSVPGAAVPPINVTGTSQAIANNREYIANNAGLVTLTLPATASIGDIIKVDGAGAGGWSIAQNASQQIKKTGGGVAGTDETTAGITGSLSSADRYDSVELICIVADLTWNMKSVKGAVVLA